MVKPALGCIAKQQDVRSSLETYGLLSDDLAFTSWDDGQYFGPFFVNRSELRFRFLPSSD